MGILKADRDYFLNAIPKGSGALLDIGGGGEAPFKAYLEQKGYIYVNLEIDPSRSKLNMCGDAHSLPFKSDTFNVVISVHSLEHFAEPSKVVSEVKRVLRNNAFFFVLVPFLTAFHGQDFWRYTPLGIRKLLDGFQIQELKATTHICANIGDFISTFFWRMKLHFLCGFVRNVSSMLDKLLNAVGITFESYAHTYLIVARKE